ncbi:aminodeoxychorismate/anthranilate synthase component II [Candidatus Micrarchaeota archaeon]|nr:aminodeoxychorismate/anthranilate synthase component II [Candidatus Micrarchaeota archaeon]
MILIIDNYDSFVYNLAQYFGELGQQVKVVRNDSITIEEIQKIKPQKIVLSPGPGSPIVAKDFGVCKMILEKSKETGVPILGVCLGHQGIIAHFGGNVVKASKPLHGKTSEIETNQRGIFKDLPKKFRVMRYHSLVGTEIPDCLEVTAKSLDDGAVMAVQHKTLPIYGVQFHPESIMSEHGLGMLSNFLKVNL